MYFTETISSLGIYSGDKLIYTDFQDLVDAVEYWKEESLTEEERADLKSAWASCSEEQE